MREPTGMKLEKISLLDYKGHAFVTNTIIRAGEQEIRISGAPTVLVFDDYIQLGCVRVSRSCAKRVAELFQQLIGDCSHGIGVQTGNYETDDPNTQPRKTIKERARELHASLYPDGKHAPINQCHTCDTLEEIIFRCGRV